MISLFSGGSNIIGRIKFDGVKQAHNCLLFQVMMSYKVVCERISNILLSTGSVYGVVFIKPLYKSATFYVIQF